MHSFSNKKGLEFQIRLGKGAKFQVSNTDTVVLRGLRATAECATAGANMMGELSAKIYGVSQSIMNDVTTMQWQDQTLRNAQIEVYAIDGDRRSLVFRGYIRNAWGNYSSPPDVFLSITAGANYYFQIEQVRPTSFKGIWKLKDMFKWYANKMGLSLELTDIGGQYENGYFDNTLAIQVQALAKDVNVDITYEGFSMIVVPKGTPRKDVKVLVSRDTGMIGYPTFDATSLTCKSIFNPDIRHFGLVELKTDINSPLVRTSGEWRVASVYHNLQSETPNGQWMTQFKANYNGNAFK